MLGVGGGNHVISMDDLDRDTGDVDSQSGGTSAEYFYEEVTGTLEGWVLRVGVGGGGGGGRGCTWGWEEVTMFSIDDMDRDT